MKIFSYKPDTKVSLVEVLEDLKLSCEKVELNSKQKEVKLATIVKMEVIVGYGIGQHTLPFHAMVTHTKNGSEVVDVSIPEDALVTDSYIVHLLKQLARKFGGLVLTQESYKRTKAEPTSLEELEQSKKLLGK